MGRLASIIVILAAASRALAGDYSQVDAIFSKNCLDCHATQDPDGKLVLESFDALMKGGESGQAILPGKSASSLLVRMVEGTFEKDGKRVIMPPGKKRTKLSIAEIATIKEWIDGGARPPALAKTIATELDVPKIPVSAHARNPINTLMHIPGTNLVAVGRYREVELRTEPENELVRTLSGHHGNVNSLTVSPDVKHLFAGSGETAVFGEIKEWNIADGKLIRTFLGHRDAVYAIAVSPDGKTLASGSYDQKIKLWDIARGKERKTLSGHNGCIFGLAFRPDGKILASASGDHTVKLWDVVSGTRRDTLSQPLKDVFAVAFNPAGTLLVAGGVDNRIRLWQISPDAAETSNPLLDSKFAAEGAILRLVYSTDGKLLLSSADDNTVRLWDAVKMKEKALLEKQPDWAPGLDFSADGQNIITGRLDGTIGVYDLTGKPVKKTAAAVKKSKKTKMAKAPSDKPNITRLQYHGMQRGTEMTVKAIGANFMGLTAAKSSNPKLAVSIVAGTNASDTEVALHLKADPALPRGVYDISLVNEKGEGAPAKIYIGHLPHIYEPENDKAGTPHLASWPASYWGELNPGGDRDLIEFHALPGQTLVFDLSTRSIGSKADARMTLLDGDGHIVAAPAEADSGEPLLAYTFAKKGVYRIQITEETDAGSPDFYYRLTMGELPEVTGVFPPSVQTNSARQIQLIGYNLGGKDKVWIKPTKAGELEVPLNGDEYRPRRPFKILVTDEPALMENEPNDSPANANLISVPGVICGQIGSPNDVDLFQFQAKAGENIILETEAARRGSPLDTKIEVLDAQGKPVERMQLQAVRDSAINFRGINSSSTEIRIDNWQEMLLNQYLYMQGEVCKLFRAPRGPDSGFEFYSTGGQRLDYFDTSATDQALDEPCYIVEPHAPGEQLPPNGLPVFPLYYVNDDDADRQLGTDSRLHFIAPMEGSYMARVTDNRGRGGPGYFYRLIIRDARPDFSVTLNGASPTISPGSGRDFSLSANRVDHFDGDIRIDIKNVPPGFRISTPIVIEAGHASASGVISCETNALAPSAEAMAKIKVTATAMIDGKEITKAVNSFDKILLGGAPTLLVECEAYDAANTNFIPQSVNDPAVELTLAPGKEVPTWIKVKRKGHDDLITFEANNLPHGVIVDNIGLNGVLIPKEENERQIFLRAESWVPDTDRLFYIKAAQAGQPASFPVMLHIRRAAPTQTAAAEMGAGSLTLPRR